LIEYARLKGTLTLRSTSRSQQGTSITTTPGGAPSFSDPKSEEYRDEDFRVEAIRNGDLTVGDQDLVRIFKLRRKSGPPAPVAIEMVSGVTPKGTKVFRGENGYVNSPSVDSSEPGLAGQSSAPATRGGGNGSTGFVFGAPAEPKKDKECASCKNKKPQQ
jgi:hypothetical protein